MEHAKKQVTAATTDEQVEGDIWKKIFTPGAEVVLEDLLWLPTDYSCHGCAK